MSGGRPLLCVRDLGKRYPVVGQRRDRLRALWDIARGRPPERTVPVLSGIGFKVHRGESLAIIGVNGAGKSTLLKLITGVLTPSTGSVEVNGSVAALLELGAGFHAEHSGRDNVRMAAALHGLTGAALEAKLPEIEAFAEIGHYIDEPVKHYSSGMVVRLGFAVVAALKPDLLITDEVLAVGDESFQKKCIAWLDGYLADGGTLLLVSHSMFHVQKLCRRALWLHKGKLQALGDVFEVSQRYLAWHERRHLAEADARVAAGLDYSIAEVMLNGESTRTLDGLAMGDGLRVETILRARDGRPPVLAMGVVRADGTPIYGTVSEVAGIVPFDLGEGRFRFRFEIAPLELLPGNYRLRLHPMDPEGLRLFETVERGFSIRGQSRELGLVRLPLRWLDDAND
ncbi:MAG TPA: ABC transporter ATP-binding protein [Xanthomonadales bacterium]|nr:ABC transporter ATP-binding protein [Xanthomonadales bacterium]